jgi:hypothetical protein
MPCNLFKICLSLALVFAITLMSACRNSKIAGELQAHHARVIYNKNAILLIKGISLDVPTDIGLDIQLITRFNPGLISNSSIRNNIKLSDIFQTISITNPATLPYSVSSTDDPASTTINMQKKQAYLFYLEDQRKVFPKKLYRMDLVPVVANEFLRASYEYENYVQSTIQLLNSSSVHRSSAVNYILSSLASYYNVGIQDVDIRIKLVVGGTSQQISNSSNFNIPEDEVVWNMIHRESPTYESSDEVIFRDTFIGIEKDYAMQPAYMSIVESSFYPEQSEKRLIKSDSKIISLSVPVKRNEKDYSRFPLNNNFGKYEDSALKLLAFNSLEESFYSDDKMKSRLQPDQRTFFIRIFPVKRYVLINQGYWEDVKIQIEDIYTTSEFLLIKVNLFGKYAKSKSYFKPHDDNFKYLLTEKYMEEVNTTRYTLEKKINSLINK